MRILVIGGTQFVGRHAVDALVERGDDVTLFHRGQTNPDLYPDLEHRIGDRNGDLSALSTGQWDAVVDPSAYVPRHVHSLAEALGSRGGQYVHVSSISAYAEPSGPGINEDAALAKLDDPTTEDVAMNYGGLKALCEIATHESFGVGGPAWTGALPSIVRPTYVVGPHDHTGRFTYWIVRVARGGRMLAPEPRGAGFQCIDGRDLGNFIALLAHGEAQGTFHTAGPASPITFESFLANSIDEIGSSETEVVWINASQVREAGGTGFEFPLVDMGDETSFLTTVDPSRALSAGLQLRPLRETIRDTYEFESTTPTALRGEVGLTPEREREWLASMG